MILSKYLDTFNGGGSGGGGKTGATNAGRGGKKGLLNAAKAGKKIGRTTSPKGLLRKMSKAQRMGPAKGFALGKKATAKKRLGRVGRAAADATDRFSAKNVARNIRAGEKVDMNLFSRAEAKQIRTALKKR